jgi:hypothetical protein
MQLHECNKHNYLCINDSLNFFIHLLKIRVLQRRAVSGVFLWASPGLHFNQSTLTKPELSFFEKLMADTWSSDYSAIYRGLQLCLAISNDLSLAIGFSRIDRKVTLCN